MKKIIILGLGSGILYAGMRFSGQDPGRYH